MNPPNSNTPSRTQPLNNAQQHPTIAVPNTPTTNPQPNNSARPAPVPVTDTNHTNSEATASLPLDKTSFSMSLENPEGSVAKVPRSIKSEIRKHYFTDEYVIISSKKDQSTSNQNPNNYQNINNTNKNQLVLGSSERITDTIDIDGRSKIVSIENPSPILEITNSGAYGYEEIIIDNTRPEKYLSSLNNYEMTNLIAMYKRRYLAIKELKHIEYISVFKNSGTNAGSLYNYQYSQIIASNHIPNRVNYLQTEANNFFNQRYENPISIIIDFEHSSSLRVIEENINWISFCPYFSIYPLEVWVLPKMPFQHIGQISDSFIPDLVSIMRKVITKLDRGKIDYNYYFINAINENMTLQIHIVPRLSPNNPNGYEVANTEYINPVSPEDAAKWYNNS